MILSHDTLGKAATSAGVGAAAILAIDGMGASVTIPRLGRTIPLYAASGVAAATIESPAFESRPAPGTAQPHNASSAAEIKAYETWCLWFGSGARCGPAASPAATVRCL